MMEKMHCLVFPIGYLFLICFVLTYSGVTTQVHKYNISSDQIALLAFKNHITSESDAYQNLSRNWSASSSSSVCEWIGVTCGSRHRRVTALNVSYMGLSGTIPPQLGNLSFLVSLNISGNNFRGELPNELSHLRRLKVLDFGINNLGGEIPSWIGSLHQLQFLSLRNNSFNGSIPTSISNLSNLELLWLSDNSLQGSIPVGIGSLHNLKQLAMKSNQISGPIPHEMFNISTLEVISLSNNDLSGGLPISPCNLLRRLTWLSLSMNKLNGSIPSSLSHCSELKILSLSFNEFVGFIPEEIGSLKALEELYLGANNLKGEIPRQIGNLTTLKNLYLGSSNLSGVIPREFGNLYHLKEIDLESNNLSGSIPVEIFNISTIYWINLVINRLSGNLPSTLCGGLPNLEHLSIDLNNLHGVLPESISNCSNLKAVDLGGNKFVGSIPNSLGNLRLLESLNLEMNYFTNKFSSEFDFINFLTNCIFLRKLGINDNPLSGYLPESIGNLSTSLQRFYAYNCRIKGEIPQGFGNLSSLFVLNLGGNQLTGSIPEAIKGLQQLQNLDLHSNELNKARIDILCTVPKLSTLNLVENQILESIPECLGNITSLRYLYLYSNRFTLTIPTKFWNLKDLLELDLSTNFISGFLPPQVGNLKALTLLDLSVNNLSSEVPNTIGDLEKIDYISLAFNSFQGSIPESMGKMMGLETLDLSHNNLSGIIPMILEKLQYLKNFNVSFNGLSGEIPSHGPFQNLTSKSFMFNKALCGAPRFHVPLCTKTSPPKLRSKRRPVVLVLLLCLGAFVGAIALVIIYIQCLKKSSVLVPRMTISLSPSTQENFSYYKLLYATNGFNESNLLGKGSFGSVYRGTIDEGRIVAIKVFHSEVQEAFKSFNKECEVLRNLRHRNLTKVISNCSTPDFKALILEFMPSGSLEKWLYSHNYFLNIMQRLDIMIDVAVALEYLHNGYSTPVVHCDLKPSNILLDQDMVAHVSDFGISKFLGHEDSVTYTQTIATFGYIAPEYGFEGLVSPKCDVYSYGIMMMEVFTRTKPNNEMFCGNFNLRSWVSDSLPNRLATVLDSNVLSSNNMNFNKKMDCLYSIIEVALNCTKESPRERSNMKDVIASLKRTKVQLLTCHHKES